MAEVTIEGSLTPSVFLAKGQRRTVQLTEQVQQLIDRGYVVLVHAAEDGPPPAGIGPLPTGDETTSHHYELADATPGTPGDDDDNVPPPHNASRDAWASFLTRRGIWQAEDDSRDDLIDRWDAYQDDDS